MDNNKKNETKFSYASAPYNFIPFPDKVVYRYKLNNKKSSQKNFKKDLREFIEETPLNHNQIYKKEYNLKSGYIDYSLKTLTPVFIDNGNESFFNINDKYCIPASTIRGKIYSNAEILSSSYPDFIKDKKYWYRGCFEESVLKSQYNNFLKLNSNIQINECVRAGYLINKKGKWFIIPAKSIQNKQFKIIKEDKLLYLMKYLGEESYMYDIEGYNKNTNKDFWDDISKLKNNERINLLKKYKKPMICRNIKNELKYFKPYFVNVTYSISQNNNVKIKAILNDRYKKLKGFKYGMLMNSNNSGNKQVHYLIYEEDTTTNPLEVKQYIIDQYNINCKLKHSEEIAAFNFKKAKSRGRMPIFYILKNNGDKAKIVSVGFTPYLKVPYKYTIKELVNTKKEESSKKNINLDYVQSIFGFSNLKIGKKSYSLKGKVSFTNAKLYLYNNKEQGFEKGVNKVLSEPKPTSFQLYLRQDNIVNKNDYIKNLSTYNEDTKLRGNKFYWLKNDCDRENNKNKNVGSEINAIKKGFEFKGRIYFENLQEDELGLLLMAIKPFESSKDNIGKGKPYGFGKVEFKIEDIKEINIEDRFKSLNLQYTIYDDLEGRIKHYNNKFIEKLKSLGEDITSNTNIRIKAFKESKLEEKNVYDNKFKYMDLKKFKDRKPLKDIELYINKNDKDAEELVALEMENELNINIAAKLLSKKYNVVTKKEGKK